MGNEDNLKRFGKERSVEEAREMGKLGGQKSGDTRRRKKNMKACAKALMDIPVSKKRLAQMKQMGIEEEDATYKMSVMVAMLQEALQGNVKAAQFVREMIGEDPKQEMHRKEMKLKTDEFKYRKEQDSKNQQGTGDSDSNGMSVNIYMPQKESDDDE